MTLEARFAASLECLGATPVRIGVAVSGGGDSVALMHLAHGWAKSRAAYVAAVTVDHGLRVESKAEAETVAKQCADLGVLHDVLHWQNWDGAGNLQNAARSARYGLISDWARAAKLDAVLIGHTEDDIAETFLMRLARKSGVGGLSAMADQFTRDGVAFLRPLSQVSRMDLRAYLQAKGLAWVDDPSNDDPVFDRVKIRRALTDLAPLGLDAAAISTSARALADVKSAVLYYAKQEGLQRVTEDRGDLTLDLSGDLPTEIRRRLISIGLHWFGRQDYPPRGAVMANLDVALQGAAQHTAAGVLVRKVGPATLHMTRELGAISRLTAPTDQLWDKRWRLHGPHSPDVHISALGNGIKSVDDWRGSGLSRASAMATPAIWKGNTCISAPVLSKNTVWHAEIVTSFEDFLLSH